MKKFNKSTPVNKYAEAKLNLEKLYSLSCIDYYFDDGAVNHAKLQKIMIAREDLKNKIRKVYPNFR